MHSSDGVPGANVHVSSLLSLQGRVALVTGGAGQYGRHISRALAEAGATVLVASRDEAKCRGFVEELNAFGYEAYAFTLDLTSDRSVNQLAANIVAKWHRLDILFNNAVTVSAGPLEKHAVQDWAHAMECNSTGVYRLCQTFGSIMAGKKSGSIINIASVYGVVSPDFRIYEGREEITNPPSYGFAKAGMIQLTRYLAVYFAPHGVRVNCISPGGLYSEIMPPDFVERYCSRTPLGRMAGPNDIKGAAVFLASDASAYITGQNLLVDGGLTIL
jgi:NAD(P)-dependent dehydrogenase (short-subunit alcohol dehydrogenase family)